MTNPITSAEVEKAFIEDFKALLKKHDVEFSISENIFGYSFFVATADIFGYAQYDSDGNIIRECVEFELPKNME